VGSEVAKADLQALAQEKLDDAVSLVTDHRWSNGYYLAGYAVELALKACIAKTFKADTIPDKDFVNATYSHNFRNLVGTAGLSIDLRTKEQADANFAANWGVVSSWSPNARYARATQQQAEELLRAISAEDDGVFAWIKAFW
jgi:HEPN domain-containing protein